MAHVVVLSGGGSSGHISPALALASVIAKSDEVRFIGTERGVGTHHIRAAGYPVDVVESKPVVDRGPLAKLLALGSIVRGTIAARGALRRSSADLVIGVGGYASVPAVAAALTLRIPAVLLEADIAPGAANRMLGRYARRVFVQYEEAAAHFPAGRTEVVGFPVRPIPAHKEDEGGLRLLVTGGSQGAHAINLAMMAAIPQLAELGLRITHQTGPADSDEVRTAYQQADIDATVAPFFDDLPERLARTDLAVGRAGASTVAEFCTAGVAHILVPYPPHAAGGHQAQNAAEVEQSGACRVIPNAEASERLGTEIAALVRDSAQRVRMAEAARRRASPDAAARIWQRCQDLLPGDAS